jgi:hypothetical protein
LQKIIKETEFGHKKRWETFLGIGHTVITRQRGNFIIGSGA